MLGNVTAKERMKNFRNFHFIKFCAVLFLELEWQIGIRKEKERRFAVLSRAWDKGKILSPHQEWNVTPSDSAFGHSTTISIIKVIKTKAWYEISSHDNYNTCSPSTFILWRVITVKTLLSCWNVCKRERKVKLLWELKHTLVNLWNG